MKKHFVYILLCSDGSFYTGYAVDLEKRVFAHNHSRTGAKYTKTRRPVTLLYSEVFSSRGEALKREFVIKQLSKEEKTQLISKT